MTDSIKVACRFRRDKEGEEIDEWQFHKEINTIQLRDKNLFMMKFLIWIPLKMLCMKKWLEDA